MNEQEREGGERKTETDTEIQTDIKTVDKKIETEDLEKNSRADQLGSHFVKNSERRQKRGAGDEETES